MNAPMRASVVKSPEHFEFARQTSTDPAALVLREPITNLSPTRETVTILSWRLLWSVTYSGHDQLLYVSASLD